MAARAAIEPYGCQRLHFAHACSPSRMIRKYGRNSGCLRTLLPARVFSKMAPVGQTCTHLPQLVQVSEAPQGSFRSVITSDWAPRPITPQVLAPSISEQT